MNGGGTFGNHGMGGKDTTDSLRSHLNLATNYFAKLSQDLSKVSSVLCVSGR